MYTIEHNCTDPIVIQNCIELLRRSEVWIAKYWITLEDNKMPIEDWIQNSIEELLDWANYLRWLKNIYISNTHNGQKES